MDPFTQGAFGASWSLSASTDKKSSVHFKRTLVFAWLAGMAPDLDVFIRSSNDPLLFLEYHRQFTHSLIFIPLGAYLTCLVLRIFFKRFFAEQSFLKDYWVCLFGYASHGVLDACTSYGTQLFWPFSDFRVSWNLISIIDPIFTGLLVTGLLLSFKRQKVFWCRLFLLLAFSYLFLGLIQHHRVKSEVKKLAQKREHVIEKLTVKPSFANLWLWKSIYATEDRFYVDALKVLWDAEIFEGESTKRYNLSELKKLAHDSDIQKKDITRFYWFSQGYVALASQSRNYLVDIRYSLLPNKLRALWGIKLDPGSDEHVSYVLDRNLTQEERSLFFFMLF